MKSIEENRLVLRLLAAVSAAEDRLTESTPAPEEDALVVLLRAAILETERSFPATAYTAREFPKA